MATTYMFLSWVVLVFIDVFAVTSFSKKIVLCERNVWVHHI